MYCILLGILLFTIGNHYWQYTSTKLGPLINTVRIVNDDKKIDSLKNDYIHSLTPYYIDNVLMPDYIATLAIRV
jgi:hypothetical protein